MMRQQAVWRLISNSLRQDIAVMLLYVLDSRGSSPGRRGFMMAVNANGEMQGSIGGGIMEHKFAEMAKEKLADHERVLSLKKQIHDKTAAKNQSGMICSGEQTILLYHLRPGDEKTVENVVNSLQQNQNGLLRLSPKGIQFEAYNGQEDVFIMRSEDDWLYEEQTGYKNHLHIIGGGHCASALSKIMHLLGFYIYVYEDRPDLNTLLQNEHVHQKILVSDFSELDGLIPPGKAQYVVVMTAGYRTDDIALRALLNKDLKYLGVLGSKKKMKKMFTGYIREGIDPGRLRDIHSPVGIQIRSQTPEEIAVSIAAEIIQIKNEML